jgi:manganese-dependent inorganic pyrophosphatase
MSEILVIGHRNPDTDAICSAIGYAEFKRRTGMTEAVAARCGDTNDRIDFVLKTLWRARAEIRRRRFAENFRRDAAENFERAARLDGGGGAAADGRKKSPHPARDGRRAEMPRPAVAVQTEQISFSGGQPPSRPAKSSREVLSSLASLARTLDGQLVVGVDAEREDELILMIGAMGLESFAARLDKFPPEKCCVIVGDRWDIQNVAIREGVRVLIVTGGITVEPKTIEAAQKKNVSVITSPHDTATTASLCRAAVAVRHVLNEEFLCFRENAPLAAVREEATASGYLAFPVLDSEGQTVGILSKTDFLKTVSRKLILVDHNELSQAVQGADEVEIIEIIDHHRLGSLATQQPILFRNEPVGSTSTIVADCFFRHDVELPRPIAGLLLAGVVSDTLNLTSPTTTTRDAEILKKLEVIAQVNAREFTEKLFASGSLLTLKPAPQAVATDCKEYAELGVEVQRRAD